MNTGRFEAAARPKKHQHTYWVYGPYERSSKGSQTVEIMKKVHGF